MDLDDLPEEGTVQPRQTRDAKKPSNACWGPELMEMCATEDLLMLNGRTQGNYYGQCTFHRNASASTVDYFIASSGVFSQTVTMYVLSDELAQCTLESDHYPTELWLLAVGPPSMASEAVARVQSIKWDASKKEDYAIALQATLHKTLGPGGGQTLEIDHLMTV